MTDSVERKCRMYLPILVAPATVVVTRIPSYIRIFIWIGLGAAGLKIGVTYLMGYVTSLQKRSDK